MYQIALCEDEKIFSDAQEKICREILDKLNIEYQISVFASSADFLDIFVEQQKRFDLILLDIVMDGVDGMTLARRIRQTDADAVIIFITSNQDYALQGYDVNALHYLIKPVDTQVLERLITAVYTQKHQDNIFIIKSGKQHLRVHIKDIVCMETAGRRVEISMMDGIVYYSGKLTDILNELPKGQFVRCHNAFAVNIKNIRKLTRQNIIAINGKEIPVSRTFLNETRKSFLSQMGTE